MENFKNQAGYNRLLKKLLLKMKLTLTIFLFCLAGAAASTYSQNTRLSVSLKNGTMVELIKQIEAKSEFMFYYQKKELQELNQITVEAKNATVMEILDKATQGTAFDYTVIDRYIVVRKIGDDFGNNFLATAKENVAAQQPAVSGKVTDESGQPLPGVTVVVKGTTQGTVTNANGEYSISSLPENATLQFSFVGMRTQEVVVGSQTSINVEMQEETIGIEEVVAIGYGSLKKEQITSSIASVNTDDFLQGAVYQSPLELLQGKIGGLAISRAGGGDPTAGVEIQLRGVSSIRGSTSPLIIIDGIPGASLDAVSPESIEKIDVLRDGSAAAIYGTRATNGVIIITTKKGTPGKLKTTYSAYAYTENWFNKPRLLNANEYLDLKNDLINSGEEFLINAGNSIVDYGADTDWLDAITQTSLSHVHDLSFSGGSESTQYFASFNYRDQTGLVKTTGSQVMTQRISLTHSDLDDRLIARFNMSNSITKYNPSSGEAMIQALDRNPTKPVYNKDRMPGEEAYNPDGLYHEELGYYIANPLGLLEQFHRDNERSVFLGNIYLQYEIVNNLRASVNGGYMRTNGFNGYYESRESWANYAQNSYRGVASRNASNNVSRTLESTLDYSNLIGRVHDFNAMVGYGYQDNTYSNFSANNRSFISDAFLYNNLGAGVAIGKGLYASPVSSGKSSDKLISFFGRLNYSYASKYLLSLSMRREGSSKFGKDNKWGNFPAASVGWTVSREPFMENFDFIDNLKIRFGYGVTGNHGISSYLAMERLGTGGLMYYDGDWTQGVVPASNANPNLRWEKKAESNLGIDLDMLNSVSINLDLYNRKTTDLLYQYSVPVPPNLYGSTWANVGEINNKGIELTVNATPITSSNFSWSTNFNISYNKNLLVSLSNEEYSHDYLLSGNLGGRIINREYPYKLEEGQPVGNLFGYEHAGISEEGMWLIYDAEGNKIPGSQGTFDDKKIIGNGLPKGWYGFTNTFKYRDLDLTVALRGAFDYDILNTWRIARDKVVLPTFNLPLSAKDNPELYKLREQGSYMTDQYLEPGAYLKLDNLTLGYTLPLDYFTKCRIYFSGRNLFAITKFTGEDPEGNISGLTPSYSSWTEYPKVKTFTVGLNITF